MNVNQFSETRDGAEDMALTKCLGNYICICISMVCCGEFTDRQSVLLINIEQVCDMLRYVTAGCLSDKRRRIYYALYPSSARRSTNRLDTDFKNRLLTVHDLHCPVRFRPVWHISYKNNIIIFTAPPIGLYTMTSGALRVRLNTICVGYRNASTVLCKSSRWIVSSYR